MNGINSKFYLEENIMSTNDTEERVICPQENNGTDYPAEKPWTGAPIPSTGEKPRYAKLPKHHHRWVECDQSGMVVKTFRKNKTKKEETPPQTSTFGGEKFKYALSNSDQ